MFVAVSISKWSWEYKVNAIFWPEFPEVGCGLSPIFGKTRLVVLGRGHEIHLNLRICLTFFNGKRRFYWFFADLLTLVIGLYRSH